MKRLTIAQFTKRYARVIKKYKLSKKDVADLVRYFRIHYWD